MPSHNFVIDLILTVEIAFLIFLIGRHLYISRNNWAGYSLVTPINNMSASWVVPNASGCAQCIMSVWIGISPSTGSDPLIQIGTVSGYAKSTGAWGAGWHESLPQEPSMVNTPFSTNPGDIVVASIRQANNGRYILTLDDLTKHINYSTTYHYGGSEQAADFVVEREAVDGQWIPYPDLSDITMFNLQVNGQPACVVARRQWQIIMPNYTLTPSLQCGANVNC